MINAYVLSLNKEPRNEQLIPNLISADIKVNLLTGITPESANNLPNINERRKFTLDRLKSQSMNGFELACALGHHKMYEQSILKNDSCAFFFEDDAVLNLSEFLDFVSKVKYLPSGIFLLGACGGAAWRKPLNVLEGNRQTAIYKVVENIVGGSHAYFADRNVISNLYKKSINLRSVSDKYPRSRKVRLYVVFPYVSTQQKNPIVLIHRDQNLKQRSFILVLVTSIVQDILDLAKFGFLSGRSLFFFSKFGFLKKIIILLPGCRD